MNVGKTFMLTHNQMLTSATYKIARSESAYDTLWILPIISMAESNKRLKNFVVISHSNGTKIVVMEAGEITLVPSSTSVRTAMLTLRGIFYPSL